MKRIFAGFVAIAMVLTLVGGVSAPAQAQTVESLLAMIAQLQAQLAALMGGSTGATVTFTSDLTIGSRGTDVTALQNWLISKGFSIPAGATGYFGTQTKAAVAAWQASANIAPAVGYFGPISRGVVNAMVGPVTPPTTTPTPTTPTPGISTPGVEGTVTVSLNPSPASGTKLYENESMKGILGIKLEAKTSDIRIERVKIDLDNVTSGNSDNELYRKIARKVYVMDGSTVLGSIDLNTSTVVEDGANRFITVSGMNFVVPKDSTKVLTIALDANSTWDSAYDNDSWSLGVPVDGVRGIDGAGINQYGPSTAFTRNFTSAADLVDSATLAVSLNSGTPNTQQVICDQGTDEDECDNLEVAKFDFKTTKDSVKITDFVLDIVRTNNATPLATGNVATATTAYLYDGNSLVGSASGVGTSPTVMTATFSDIDWTVPADTTRTLSVRFDVDDAALGADTFVASTDAGDTTAENTAGTTVTATGSADGKTITIRKVGPAVSLVSKSVTTSGVPQSDTSNSLSTSTLSATFNVKIKSVGGILTLGTVASGTPLFASSTASFKVYRDGSYDSVISSYSTSTSYAIPNTCVSGGTNSCTLADGAEVTVPVTFQIVGRTTSASLTRGSLYSVQLSGIQWWNATTGTVQTTTFMDGESDWRTNDVSFP